ncbi:MAG TPA: dienelactone hydrolase family protein [Acidimicrobiia bacterium]|nr:dienelactone hydrolase family protein [Acidimicrobiia bacterium]
MSHETIEIRTDDGVCPTQVFKPTGTGPWPTVLFFMDGIGMRPAMHALGERLAAGGYYVLMPDMFYRSGPYTAPDPKQLFSDEATRKAHFGKFFAPDFMERAMRDTRAFLAYLDGEPAARADKIGTTGYCMGGRLSLMTAGHFGERIAAAAAFHPGNVVTEAPDSTHLLAPKMRAKVYVAGASEDATFTDEHKQKLDAALTEAGVDHVVETYPARHGWVPSDTPVHDDACAERHWRALFDLFGKTLMTK